MPQSLARIHIHLIFSTKNRARFLCDDIRTSLHARMAKVLKSLGCKPTLINSVEEHVHILFELGRTVSISDVVEAIKVDSSKWLKTEGNDLKKFAWQAGYGAFAVSQSNVLRVRDYIGNQRKHHQRKSFQDEFREFLKRHEIEYDERYVWD